MSKNTIKILVISSIVGLVCLVFGWLTASQNVDSTSEKVGIIGSGLQNATYEESDMNISKSVTSESSAEVDEQENQEPVYTEEYAYIADLTDSVVSLDFVDVYVGSEAEKKLVEDGKCSDLLPDGRCGYGVPIYDRNVNPKLRSFDLADDLVITDMRGHEVTLQQVLSNPDWLMVSRVLENGYRNGLLFKVTFGENNKVIRLDGQFRP